MIALTLGVGVGAVARDGHGGDSGEDVAARKPHATASSSPQTPQQRLASYAREHAFAFFDPPTAAGAFDRWDPCVPIHYRVNVAVKLPGALDAIDAAFSQVAVATGMQFVDDGATQEMPSDDRKDIRRTTKGWEWAPVLVAVVPHAAFRRSVESTDLVAFAAPDVYASDDGTLSQIVSGEIVVDGSRISNEGAGDPDGMEPVMLHEIGHLVGLGHVRDKGEIMQPDGGGVVGLGPGDLAGLWALGTSAGCFVHPALPRDSSDFPRGG